jgi:signal transduction histidine kinase
VPIPRFLATSTFRLALIYAALFSVSAVSLAGVTFWTMEFMLERQRRETVLAEANLLADQFRRFGPAGLSVVISERIRPDRVGDGIYLLASPIYLPLAGNLSDWPTNARHNGSWLEFEIERIVAGQRRVLGVRAIHLLLPDGYHLLVGQDLSTEERLRSALVNASLWGIVVTVGLGLAVGFIASRNFLGRIEAINRATERIRAGEVEHRMPVSGNGDEFDRLSHNLNAMLDEIQRLLAGIRAVTDNIAHDLRTPLSRLKNGLELALGSRGEEERRQAIERAIGEADQLLRTFSALLAIADAEAGASRIERKPVDLEDLARDVVDLYEPVADEHGAKLSLSVEEAASVDGDRQLLFQLLANLIDNAIKYGAGGGAVDIRVGRRAGQPEIAVADRGPGIPGPDRERVLERFVRLDESRTTPGTGLGLTLVNAIARLHNAELELGDNAPGLVVRVRFPAGTAPAVPAEAAQEARRLSAR